MRGSLPALLAALACAAPAGAASLHLYSYDPADAATTEAAGPLTFEVRKGLLHTTVLALRSTTQAATADLRPVSAHELGGAGLAGVAGADGRERDLYEVMEKAEGPQLVAALCPGARRGWLAFGKVRRDQDLQVEVLGEAPGAAPKLCRTLAFAFHGEWAAPPTGPVLRERDLPHGRFPGT